MTGEESIGLRSTLTYKYQKKLHEDASNIMQNRKEISLATLKATSLFSGITNSLSEEMKEKLDEQINKIAGDSIDINELKTILLFMDAKLENRPDIALKANHNLNVEKPQFVMDGKYEVMNNSGIFRAYEHEVKGILESEPLYTDGFENNGKIIDMQPDGKMIARDKDGNELGRIAPQSGK